MVDRTALVLIDAQVRFLFGPPALHRVELLLDVLETLTKRSTDAFHETGLGELLASLEVSCVVVARCITNCVSTRPAARALTSGYHTTLVADGHSTLDRPMHGVSAAQVQPGTATDGGGSSTAWMAAVPPR